MSASANHPDAVTSVDDQMQHLENSITELGAAILKLKNEHAADDAEIASELEHRYATLKSEYEELKRAEASSAELSDKAEQSWEDAKARVSAAYDDFKNYVASEETAKKWKHGAKEVGDGVSKAWSELSSSFERAYQRFQDRRQNRSN